MSRHPGLLDKVFSGGLQVSGPKFFPWRDTISRSSAVSLVASLIEPAQLTTIVRRILHREETSFRDR